MRKLTTKKDYLLVQRRNNAIILSSQIILLFSFFLIWEFLAYKNIINVFLFSKPSRIFTSFVENMSSNLMHHILISSLETILGLIIGTIGGILISTIIYLSKTLQKIIDPFLTILNALPKTALGPVIIIILGTSYKGIIGVCVSLNIIITIISSLNYFNKIDNSYIKMMLSFNASKIQILFKLIYPANISNFFSILKVNIGLSWIGTIVGEFLVSKEGIGYLIVYGSQVFKMDLVMMGVSVLSFIALFMYLIICILEKITNNVINKKSV